MNTFMNNEPIMKSMSVARHEFIGNSTDLINSCMLLPFVIEEVQRETYIKISVLSKQQLENDPMAYRAALEKTASKDVPMT